LSPYTKVKFQASPGDHPQWHPVEQARNAMVAALAASDDNDAHESLVRLKTSASSVVESHWLQTFVLAHAVNMAQRRAVREPATLAHIGDAYCRDPETATELCQQVISRLEQIRANVESGPFSDRLLFKPGMPEKHLQLWLAARLNDTPNRKFSARYAVHREPEVDRTKRTDIEVSARGFKVCIEIKPVDKSRYSAAELEKTLKKQLIDQYLKGGSNSRHGVLVLLLLEDKHWTLPTTGKHATFPHLIEHLCQHAQVLHVKHPRIDTLAVFGIDCR